MYKLINDPITNKLTCIQRLADNLFIPVNSDNTDYANFKKEVLAGAELQDADGNVMTQANQFVASLP